MNMTLTPLRKAKGSVLVLTALSLIVLMGMAGLAIDLSHAYTNKTRLQNAIDATALSAVRTLYDDTKTISEAESAGKATFDLFLNSTDNNTNKPNKELIDNGVSSADITFYYSDTLKKEWSGWITPWTGTQKPKFLTASYNDNTDTFSTWFMSVLNLNNFTLSAIATAAAHPIESCNNWPVMMCTSGSPLDTDCKFNPDGTDNGDVNGQCFGYPMYSKVCIKQGSGANTECDSLLGGHFMLVSLPGYPPGNDVIRELLAGLPVACLGGNTINNQTGNAVGPVSQGINTRFSWANAANLDNNIYPPDHVTMNLPVTNSEITSPGSSSPLFPATLTPTTSGFKQYEFINSNQTSYTGGIYSTSSEPVNSRRDNRRIVSVPVADCSTGDPGSSGSYDKLGYACMFLNKPAEGTGLTQSIFAEIIGDCSGEGKFNDQVQTDSFDFVLYQSPYQP
ncbi:MAG: TadE/TadG family type IV pilus assembly protein [Methylobacter sp.]